MDSTALDPILEHVSSSLLDRNTATKLVLAQEGYLAALIPLATDPTYKYTVKAAWILEFACKQDLGLLIPHLETFVMNLGKVTDESALRPMAKICEILMDAYDKGDPHVKQQLNKDLKELLVGICFDWLIHPHKVATQAHAMSCLLVLGKEFDWVHPELQMTLEQGYPSGSAAYQARARMIFKALKRWRKGV